MKLCKDCKWCCNPGHFTKCVSPKNKTSWSYTDTHRFDGWFWCRIMKTCGKEGRWWEEAK